VAHKTNIRRRYKPMKEKMMKMKRKKSSRDLVSSISMMMDLFMKLPM